MGGSRPAPTASESTKEILSAYTQYLPGLFQATNAQIMPTELAQLAASQAVSPQYAALQNQLFQQYMPQLAEAGNRISASNKMSEANAEASVLSGPGKQIVDSSLGLAKTIDPQFFHQREATSAGLDKLLGSFGPLDGSLSGGEREAISRSIGADNAGRGLVGNPSNIETVAAASRFGDAASQKQIQQQSAFGQALGNATGFLQQSRAGIDPVQAALGRPSINPGMTQFQGAKQNTGQDTFGMGQQFLGNIANQNQAKISADASRRDSSAQAKDIASTVSSGVGTLGAIGCCFIFLEATNGQLPRSTRYFRNLYYNLEPDVARGYKRMARWLVPLMQRSEFIKDLVNQLMVSPMIAYGEYLSGNLPYGKVAEGRKTFWFGVWKLLGKGN